MLKFLLQTLQRGAVAQLEEYLNGIQGVVGSNPISSTNIFNGLQDFSSLKCRVRSGKVPYGFHKRALEIGVSGRELERVLQRIA